MTEKISNHNLGGEVTLKTNKGIRRFTIPKYLPVYEKQAFVKKRPQEKGVKTLKDKRGTLVIEYEFMYGKNFKQKHRVTGQATTTNNQTISRDYKELVRGAYGQAVYKFREETGVNYNNFKAEMKDYYINYYFEGKSKTLGTLKREQVESEHLDEVDNARAKKIKRLEEQARQDRQAQIKAHQELDRKLLGTKTRRQRIKQKKILKKNVSTRKKSKKRVSVVRSLSTRRKQSIIKGKKHGKRHTKRR